MGQVGGQAGGGGVLNRAAVEGQGVGGNADAISIAVPRLHGVVESQRVGAGARSIAGVAGGAADGEGQARRSGYIHHLAELRRRRDGFAPGVGIGVGGARRAGNADGAHRGLGRYGDVHGIGVVGVAGYRELEGQGDVGAVGG